MLRGGGGVYRLAMTPRRSARLRTPLLVVGVLLLLVAAAAGVALAVRPAAAGVPLDPSIPNEQALIARGLSGVPGPGQPTAPIAVDRVVADGATTYVQFHTAPTTAATGPAGPPFPPFPDLLDDTGARVNYGGGLHISPPMSALLMPVPLPSWFPWHPPVVTRGVFALGPLPSTTRAAVLRFNSTPGETVRVSLNLAALRRVRAYTGPLVQRAGLQLRVAAARDTGLVLGYGLANDSTSFGDLRGVTLRDAHGHTVPLTMQNGACSSGGIPDIQLACRSVWTYPLQPHGERLTLSIRSFAATTSPVGPGPWRLPVVIP